MAPALKNLYNRQYIELLSQTIIQSYPTFNKQDFILCVFHKEWINYELKERMHHIAKTLGEYLPQEYPAAIKILKMTFNKMNDSYGLENMIFQNFVELFGLNFFETSMQALETFTINSSSEFAIRRFILEYEERTMAQLLLWSTSENEQIRRLASEGCRPRLPWATSLPAFKKDPTKVLQVLEQLKDDKSAYVRKSVANNLNDISKDHPELLKELTKEWIGFTKERDAVLKHACRTLLKASDSETLALFGFSQAKNISLDNFIYTQSIKMGEELAFSFDIKSPEALEKLRIEFALGFLRKNAQYNTKVFKISEGFYKSSFKKVSKTYSFKPISTRVYYKGEQKLSIIINGAVFKEVTFNLE